MSIDSAADFYLLANGVSVPASFYNKIRQHLDQCIPRLQHGFSYTLKQICGSHFWTLMSDGDRRRAGQCAADMVERGLVPLITAPSKHEYPKRYQRR